MRYELPGSIKITLVKYDAYFQKMSAANLAAIDF